MSRKQRISMIDRAHPQVSLSRQCALMDISRASLCYRPAPTRAEDLEVMALMDRQYLKTPFYGSRRMKAWLLQQGHLVSFLRAAQPSTDSPGGPATHRPAGEVRPVMESGLLEELIDLYCDLIRRVLMTVVANAL